MNRLRWITVIISAVLLVAACTVISEAKPHKAFAASPVTLNAVSGTYVSESSPSSNFCGSTTTRANGSAPNRKRILHAFNLTGAVPPGNTITSATLKLYSRQTATATINAYQWGPPTNSNWPSFPSGCTVTWTNGGGATVGPIIGSSNGTLTNNTYVSIPIDIASVASTGNDGFLFGCNCTSDKLFNNDAGTNPPQLVLTYGPTPTTTTTTTTLPPCGNPITITTGGTYTGCYQSTSTGTPAVTLATNAAVTLDHAHIIAKGFGVQDTVTGTNLTVQDSTFDQTDPGAVVAHRAIELESPASFVSVHNQFNDGDGMWIGGGTPDPFNVRDNLVFNIGRYPHPTSGNCCVQFLQLDHVTVSAGVVAYNKVVNTSGQSGVEDNINFYFSGGSDSTHKIDVHHNLIDGAYPLTPDPNFTGGGIMGADGGTAFTGGHVNMHDNTVVSTTNYGLACAGGTDCHAFNNVTINDRLGSDGSTFFDSNFGQAYSIHDTTGSDVTSGSYNWLRNATDGQQSCWMSQFCSGLVQVSTTEQQARDNWTAAVPAGELPIGPRP
jgi:hypothetical protein